MHHRGRMADRQRALVPGTVGSPVVVGVRRPRRSAPLAALIVPDLVHPSFAELAKGLSVDLRDTHTLAITSTEDEAAAERRQMDALLASDVDTLFIASVQTRAGSVR